MHWPSLLFSFAPMLGLLVGITAIDLRWRRIPNLLSVALVLTGIVQSFLPSATVTPAQSLAGMLVGFALPFSLYLIGALGGGDVKMLSGVGAWMGAWPAAAVFAVAILAAAAHVVVHSLYRRRLKQVVGNSMLVGINLLHIRQLGVAHVSTTGQACQSLDKPLPYGLFVLIAALITLAALA